MEGRTHSYLKQATKVDLLQQHIVKVCGWLNRRLRSNNQVEIEPPSHKRDIQVKANTDHCANLQSEQCPKP